MELLSLFQLIKIFQYDNYYCCICRNLLFIFHINFFLISDNRKIIATDNKKTCLETCRYIYTNHNNCECIIEMEGSIKIK